MKKKEEKCLWRPWQPGKRLLSEKNQLCLLTGTIFTLDGESKKQAVKYRGLEMIRDILPGALQIRYFLIIIYNQSITPAVLNYV